ncbi:MAG TPA: methyltransferase domain-containing protein [Bacilli bacterium]
MDYLEMLARLGVGSAHPGGYAKTLKQFSERPLPPGANVLDAGCGTGRTACYLAKQNMRVTGVDIRPDMIAKAQKRAEEERVAARFLVADVCSLPFPAQTFDVVIAESVSVFTNAARAAGEYWRVLKSRGELYDREMVQWKPCPAEVEQAVNDFYGVRLMRAQDWRELLEKAGFSHVEFGEHDIFPVDSILDEWEHPDLNQQVDPDAFLDPEIWKTANRYAEIMEQYAEYFGYVLMIARK